MVPMNLFAEQQGRCRHGEHSLVTYFIYVTHAKLLQSSPTPCDPMDSGPSGSSVLGILQARVLEWVAMPSSRGSS